MDKESQVGDRIAQPVERRNYLPPNLKEFGPVGVLTQGGTGMFMEGVLMLWMVLNRT